MQVEDVAGAFHEVSSGSVVDKACRVKVACEFHDLIGVELSPCLIERNPAYDAREGLVSLDDL